jgi:uncharacterized protein (DUF1501 family)
MYHNNRLNRRSFLKASVSAALGIGLSNLKATSSCAALPRNIFRGRSVVFLFLQGGPSHLELFDPKMSAPVEIRSTTGEVKTKHAGITFGGTFPKLAAISDQFSIVRSYGTQNSQHTYLAVAGGGNPLNASTGAIFAKLSGATNPDNGIPRHILIRPEAVQPDLKLETSIELERIASLTQPGDLGSSYAAFDLGAGGELQQDMSPRFSQERITDRHQLLANLDRFQGAAEHETLYQNHDENNRLAADVLSGGVVEAFDLTKENARTLAKYDTTALLDQNELHRWKDLRRATNLLGHQMLLARRLCEAGCGFITVTDGGWDMHADGESPNHMAAMWPKGRLLDHAVSTFLEDVRDRGLSNEILLVVSGEMGRTPRLNKNGGRDHYGELTPLLLAGGGLTPGQVIGSSDRNAERATSTPFTPANLFATMMHSLLDITQLRLERNVPLGLLSYLNDHPPIRGLGF